MEKNIDKLRSKIVKVLKEHRVSKAGLFGSYARGEAKENSDMDILIEIDQDADLIDLIKLKNALETEMKKKIDIVEYDSIRKELKDRILNEEIPLLI